MNETNRTWRRVIIAASLSALGCSSLGTENVEAEPNSCTEGFVECAGACVDLQGDGQNCGACGVLCGESQVCSAGLCQDSCAEPGRTTCGNSCVDVLLDPGHCGACGILCAAGESCSNGVCTGVSGVGGTGTGGGESGTGGAELGTGGVVDGSGGMVGGDYSMEVQFEEEQPGFCAVDGVVETNHAGFTGDGFINGDNFIGASIEWALDVGEAGTYSLSFGYANESEDRPGDVLVDGEVVAVGLSFPSTPSWSSWSSATVEVMLSAGEHRIELSSTTANGLSNIDSLTVSGSAVRIQSCDEDVGTGGADGTGGMTGGTGGTTEVAPCSSNQIADCTDEGGQIACHFGGDPGDYLVTVELGGDEVGDMVVEAEANRLMIGQTTTAPGETQRFAFTANVRVYEGQPRNPDQKGTSTGIPGLDVYIRGEAPQLTSICFETVNPAPKVFVAGDSTVCDQQDLNYSGWGQHLPAFFDQSVSVSNYADSGESSASFLGAAKLWPAITPQWEAGDWVLIQFGHNDKNVTENDFRSNLLTMVSQARDAGVHPILFTPISRVGYDLESQHISSAGANMPQIIRDLGVAEGVPVIDLTVTTYNWYQTIDWTEYFALGTDKTHTNRRGALIVAGFVADAIQDQGIPLGEHLR